MSTTTTAVAVIPTTPKTQRGVHTWGAVLLCLTIMVGLTWTRSSATDCTHRLSADAPYDVQFFNQQATADIYLKAGVPVRLIVSNLDPASKSARLRGDVSPLSDPPQCSPQFPPRPLSIVRRPPQQRRLLKHAAPAAASATITDSAPPITRDFWLHVTDTPLENPEAYQRVSSRLVAVRPTVEVYADTSLFEDLQVPALLQQQSSGVADRLELDVLPTIFRRVGRLADPDRNGRLTVLVTPWLSRLRGGTVQVRGFVRSSDLRRDIAPPFSNRADLLYLNSDLPDGTPLLTLLLHEVTHAALASQQLQTHPVGPRTSRPEWDDWLNEGVAHLTERAGGGDWSNLDYRIARYWQRPESAPLVVRDYYRSQRWRDHGCRGATFLFLDWCQRQAAQQGVTDFIPALLATRAAGVEAIEQVCQTEFADLYRQWTVSQLNRDDSSVQGRTLTSGPRLRRWHVNETRLNDFQVVGTATQFVELQADRTGWYRLQFAGDAEVPWQLTVVGSQEPRPEFDLQIGWAETSGTSPNALQLALPSPLLAGWQLEQVAFESIREPQSRIRHWSAEDLKQRSGGVGQFAIPIRDDDVSGGDSILKFKFRHSNGIVAWEWLDVPETDLQRPAAVAELDLVEPSETPRSAKLR